MHHTNLITDIPVEILLAITFLLPSRDLQSFLFVCKRTNQIFNEDSQFWKTKFRELTQNSQSIPLEKFGGDSTYRSFLTHRVVFGTSKLEKQFVPVKSSITKSNSQSFMSKFYHKKDKSQSIKGTSLDKAHNDKNYVLQLKTLSAKIFNISEIRQLIENDNFDEFIAKTTHLTNMLKMIRENDFTNHEMLKLFDLEVKKIKDITKLGNESGITGITSDDFEFVYKLLPLAIEKNLINFFHGLVDLFILQMFLGKNDFHLTWFKNKIDLLLEAIFSSNKPYFIESFVNQINKFPAMTYVFDRVITQMLKHDIDITALVQNADTLDNLYLYSKKLFINYQYEKTLWFLLRLLNYCPLQEQIKQLNVILEREKLSSESGKALHQKLHQMIKCDELSTLKNAYELTTKFHRTKLELKAAEKMLSSIYQNAASSIEKMSNQDLEHTQSKSAELIKQIVELREIHTQAQKALDDAVTASKEAISVARPALTGH